jgi:uncharacterized MAPEG superfamily protein
MTTAYICVFIMMLFPYVFTVVSKCSSEFNNRDPRGYQDRTTGWRRRAHCVQLNSFEALPAFGLAVIIAHLMQAPQLSLDKLAITFVIARFCYALCYLGDKPILRTLAWAVGIACVVGLFYISYAR